MDKKINYVNVVAITIMITVMVLTTFTNSIQIAKAETPENQILTEEPTLEQKISDNRLGGLWFSSPSNLNKEPLIAAAYFQNQSNSTISLWRDNNLVFDYNKQQITNTKFIINLTGFNQDSLIFFKDKSIELNDHLMRGSSEIAKVGQNTFKLKNNFKNLDYLQITFIDKNASINFSSQNLEIQGHVEGELVFKNNKKIYFETFSSFRIDYNLNIDAKDTYVNILSSSTSCKLNDKSCNCILPSDEIKGNINVKFNQDSGFIDTINFEKSSLFGDDNFYHNYNQGFFSYLDENNKKTTIVFSDKESNKEGIYVHKDSVTVVGKFSIYYKLEMLKASSENGKISLSENEIYSEGIVSVENENFKFEPSVAKTKFIQKTSSGNKTIEIVLPNQASALFSLKDQIVNTFSGESLDDFIPIEIKNSNGNYVYSDETIKKLGELSRLINDGNRLNYASFKLILGSKTLDIDSSSKWFFQEINSGQNSNPVKTIGKAILGLASGDLLGTEKEYKTASPADVVNQVGQIDQAIFVSSEQKTRLENFVHSFQNADWAQVAQDTSYFKQGKNENDIQIYERLRKSDEVLIDDLESGNFDSDFFNYLGKSVSEFQKYQEAQQGFVEIQNEFEGNGIKYSVITYQKDNCVKNTYLINQLKIIDGEYRTPELADLLGVSGYQLFEINKQQFGENFAYNFETGEIEDQEHYVTFGENGYVDSYFTMPDTKKTLEAKKDFIDSLEHSFLADYYYNLAYAGVQENNKDYETEKNLIDTARWILNFDKDAYAFHKYIRDNNIDKEINVGNFEAAADSLANFKFQLTNLVFDEDLKEEEKQALATTFVANYIHDKLVDEELIFDYAELDIYLNDGTNQYELFSSNPLIQLMFEKDPNSVLNIENKLRKEVAEKMGIGNKDALIIKDEESRYLDSKGQYLSVQDALKFIKILNGKLAPLKEQYDNIYAIEPSAATSNQNLIMQMQDLISELDEIWFNAYKKQVSAIGSAPVLLAPTGEAVEDNSQVQSNVVVTSPISGLKYTLSESFNSQMSKKAIKDNIKFVVKVAAVVIAGIAANKIGEIVGSAILESGGASAADLAFTCSILTMTASFTLISNYFDAAIETSFEGTNIFNNYADAFKPSKLLTDFNRNLLMFSVMGGMDKFLSNYKFFQTTSGELIKFGSEVGVFNALGLGEETYNLWRSNIPKNEKEQRLHEIFSPANLERLTQENSRFLLGMKIGAGAYSSFLKLNNLQEIPGFNAKIQDKLDALDMAKADVRDALIKLSNDPEDIASQRAVQAAGETLNKLLGNPDVKAVGDAASVYENVRGASESLDKQVVSVGFKSLGEAKATGRLLNGVGIKTPQETLNSQNHPGVFQLLDESGNVLAWYDAEFPNNPNLMPRSLNRGTDFPGNNYGYVLFHDFLSRVGVGNEFLSTDLTEGGENLYQKAIDDGLIEKISDPQGIDRYYKWRVIADPIENLQRKMNQLSPDAQNKLSELIGGQGNLVAIGQPVSKVLDGDSRLLDLKLIAKPESAIEYSGQNNVGVYKASLADGTIVFVKMLSVPVESWQQKSFDAEIQNTKLAGQIGITHYYGRVEFPGGRIGLVMSYVEGQFPSWFIGNEKEISSEAFYNAVREYNKLWEAGYVQEDMQFLVDPSDWSVGIIDFRDLKKISELDKPMKFEDVEERILNYLQMERPLSPEIPAATPTSNFEQFPGFTIRDGDLAGIEIGERIDTGSLSSQNRIVFGGKLNGKDVAIKEYIKSEENVDENVLNEIKNIKIGESLGLARYYGAIETDDGIFIITNFVQGQEFESVVLSDKLTDQSMNDLISQLKKLWDAGYYLKDLQAIVKPDGAVGIIDWEGLRSTSEEGAFYKNWDELKNSIIDWPNTIKESDAARQDQINNVLKTNLENPAPNVLTFEQFIAPSPSQPTLSPAWNNIYLIWSPEGMGYHESYLKDDFYKRFQAENPELDSKLYNAISEIIKTKSLNARIAALQPYLNDLYEAYKLMRSYGASDVDLGVLYSNKNPTTGFPEDVVVKPGMVPYVELQGIKFSYPHSWDRISAEEVLGRTNENRRIPISLVKAAIDYAANLYATKGGMKQYDATHVYYLPDAAVLADLGAGGPKGAQDLFIFADDNNIVRTILFSAPNSGYLTLVAGKDPVLLRPATKLCPPGQIQQ